MLQTHDLKVALDAELGLVKAIDGLTLAIQRGETFALVGESGCGKSMTALALMRLLPENGHVTGGDVRLDRDDLLALPEAAMRAVRGGRIGMIFQEPSTSLNPVMKIGAQIVEAIEAHTALRGAAARAKAVEWLRRVGIPEPERRIDDYPFRMSGGQKQRVMIAMTLATSITWPAYISATRCAMPATTARSCVISSIPSPCSFCSTLSRSSTCAWIVTSSAVVGSSATRKSGSVASVIAIITRCFWPPLMRNG